MKNKFSLFLFFFLIYSLVSTTTAYGESNATSATRQNLAFNKVENDWPACIPTSSSMNEHEDLILLDAGDEDEKDAGIKILVVANISPDSTHRFHLINKFYSSFKAQIPLPPRQ